MKQSVTQKIDDKIRTGNLFSAVHLCMTHWDFSIDEAKNYVKDRRRYWQLPGHIKKWKDNIKKYG